MAVCEKLLSLRPPREPTSPTVAEEGAIHFEAFVSKQSLDNRYSALLAIWREAYAEICDAGTLVSKLDPASAGFTPSELSTLDAGTRRRVELLLAMFRETVNRCNGLTKLIADSVPFRAGSAEDGTQAKLPGRKVFPMDLALELRTWIGRLDNGEAELELDDLGVRISRRCRPGDVVLSRRLIDALREISSEN